MKVKGTQRHDFNPAYVQELLEKEYLSISLEDALRMLGEACHVIHGLRQDVRDMQELAERISAKDRLWMGVRQEA